MERIGKRQKRLETATIPQWAWFFYSERSRAWKPSWKLPGSRETELKTEKSELKEEKTKILDMLAIEQEKTRLLMLSDSEHGKKQKKRGKLVWILPAEAVIDTPDLPNFRPSDTLYKSSLGWHCYETVTQRRSLPPSHCSKWIKDWRLENPQMEPTMNFDNRTLG